MFNLVSHEQETVTWFFQCKAYYDAAVIILNSPDEIRLNDPICTLKSFSIECAYKALISLDGKEVKRTHNFVELFNLLSPEIQKDLVQSFKLEYQLDLKRTLEDIKLDFMDSRYIYHSEEQGKTFSVSGLYNVSIFMYEYLKPKIEAILHRNISNLL